MDLCCQEMDFNMRMELRFIGDEIFFVFRTVIGEEEIKWMKKRTFRVWSFGGYGSVSEIC